jgi:hypothetical protein
VTDATRPRSALLTGCGTGAASFAFLFLGATRSYDLDESPTVGLFVATPSIGDAFTRAFVLNNHVFFSFLEHLVYTATGSQSELVMRTLPITFAAASVGVLAFLLTERWGVRAAVSAAAVLTTNPMFADAGSQVRGYSLLMLCTIVSTALIVAAVRRGEVGVANRVIYALVIAVGLATHLYMLVVVAIHGILSLANRSVTRRWIAPWLGGIGLGAVAYVRVWRPMRETRTFTLGRWFRPEFPLDLLVALLGGTVLATVLIAVLVGPELWRARRDLVVQFGALGVALAITGIWVIGPFDLYPRFFLWLLPLVALGVAAAVGRRPRFVLLVGAIVVVQLVSIWPRLNEDPVANATAADVFARVEERGGRACTIDTRASQRLLGYAADFTVATSREEMERCSVAVRLGPAVTAEPSRDADSIFPYRSVLHAREDGRLWSRVPVRCWLSSPPPTGEACAVVPDPVPAG